MDLELNSLVNSTTLIATISLADTSSSTTVTTAATTATTIPEWIETMRFVKISLLALMFVLIFCGNTFVLVALNNRKLRKNRMYFFLAHLSIADLVTGFFNVLPQLSWEIARRFYGGNILCKMIKFLQILGPYLSSYVLIMTSIDRYQAICYPLSNNSLSNTKRSRLMVICAWILSLMFCIPQTFIFSYQRILPLSNDSNGINDSDDDDDVTSYECWATFPEPYMTKMYVTWYAVSVFIVPFIILTWTHYFICREIWLNWHYKRQSILVKPSTSSNKNQNIIISHNNHQQQQSTNDLMKLSSKSSTTFGVNQLLHRLSNVGNHINTNGGNNQDETNQMHRNPDKNANHLIVMNGINPSIKTNQQNQRLIPCSSVVVGNKVTKDDDQKITKSTEISLKKSSFDCDQLLIKMNDNCTNNNSDNNDDNRSSSISPNESMKLPLKNSDSNKLSDNLGDDLKDQKNQSIISTKMSTNLHKLDSSSYKSHQQSSIINDNDNYMNSHDNEIRSLFIDKNDNNIDNIDYKALNTSTKSKLSKQSTNLKRTKSANELFNDHFTGDKKTIIKNINGEYEQFNEPTSSLIVLSKSLSSLSTGQNFFEQQPMNHKAIICDKNQINQSKPNDSIIDTDGQQMVKQQSSLQQRQSLKRSSMMTMQQHPPIQQRQSSLTIDNNNDNGKSNVINVFVPRTYRINKDGQPNKRMSNPRIHSMNGLTRAKIKTVKITMVVITCYVLCSLPFICVQLWAEYWPDAQKSPIYTGPFIAILMLLPSLNSCVNPWIYIYFNPNLITLFCQFFKRKLSSATTDQYEQQQQQLSKSGILLIHNNCNNTINNTNTNNNSMNLIKKNNDNEDQTIGIWRCKQIRIFRRPCLQKQCTTATTTTTESMELSFTDNNNTTNNNRPIYPNNNNDNNEVCTKVSKVSSLTKSSITKSMINNNRNLTSSSINNDHHRQQYQMAGHQKSLQLRLMNQSKPASSMMVMIPTASSIITTNNVIECVVNDGHGHNHCDRENRNEFIV